MNPSLCHSPKVFRSSRNDLKSIVTPQKTSTLASRRPAKLSSAPAPPPGEEWDVDDEEAMASPLFSVTPHSSRRPEENLVFSPFTPALPRSPNHMQTNIKSEKYLSVKDVSGTAHSVQHRATNSAILTNPSPAVRPGPVLRHLRPSVMRNSAPTQRARTTDINCKNWDAMVGSGLLKVVLPFCSIRTVVALMKLDKRTRCAREVKVRFRETLLIGIDAHTRQRLWRNVSLSIRKNDCSSRYFHSAVHCPQDIRNDIARTPSLIPGQQFSPKQQVTMMRLLDAVAMYNHDVGYCQGMNYIAGLLVQVVDNEEDCFWLMNSMMLRYKLKKLLKPGLSRLKLMCFQLDCLLQNYLPEVHAHLRVLEIPTEVYAAKWFVTLLSYELPRHLLVRVWDLFFLQGWKVIFRVILALLSMSKQDLVAADTMGVAAVLRAMAKPIQADETLLKIAFRYKVTRRLLRDLKRLNEQKYKGVYKLTYGQSRKLEWTVMPTTTLSTDVSDDSNLASRLFSRVKLLFLKDEPAEDNLDSTVCLDELPVPVQTLEDWGPPVPIKDLDSGKVHYVHPDEELCCICGSASHSSRYCSADKNGALWVFPKAQI